MNNSNGQESFAPLEDILAKNLDSFYSHPVYWSPNPDVIFHRYTYIRTNVETGEKSNHFLFCLNTTDFNSLIEYWNSMSNPVWFYEESTPQQEKE